MNPEDITAENPRLMAHLVAGYPSRAGSIDAGRGLAAGGAAYLEVQFPYSDPSADGPAIQSACDCALRHGFTVEEGLSIIRELADTAGLPVFVMSYAGMVYARGISRFVAEVRKNGGTGVIIPDLTPGNDEGLFAAGRAEGIEVVPVIPPTVTESRLQRILREDTHYLYTALRTGVTGLQTDGNEASRFLSSLRGKTAAKIIGGFGIRSAGQIRELGPLVHALVAGSFFVEKIEIAVQSSQEMLYDSMYKTISSLLNGYDEEEEKTHT